MKNGSAPTRSALAPCWVIVAHAVSISRSLSALRTVSCSASTRAAASTSLNCRSVPGKFGFTSTAILLVAGASSRINPSCFEPSSTSKLFTPVTLPPGRFKLATRPNLIGSSAVVNTIGIVEVAALVASAAGVLVAAMTLAANQIGRQRGQSVILAFCPAILDRGVLPFDVASFLQPLAKRADERRKSPCRCTVEETDHRHRRLLRARREWPRRGAAQKRDEVASLHCLMFPVPSTERIAHLGTA